MKPPSKNSSSGRLAKALDAKVLSLVRQFVSEQSSDEPTLSLKLSAISAYVSSDPSLTRHKKQTLEKSIERALDVIHEEEEDEDELDSEFEGLEVGNLMVPDEKQSNTVNKRITDMWGLNSGTPSDAGKTSAPQTPKTELPQPVVEPAGMAGAANIPLPPLPGSPKRKRKDKGDEGRAKRQKGTIPVLKRHAMG
jgi:hypothetical protein